MTIKKNVIRVLVISIILTVYSCATVATDSVRPTDQQPVVSQSVLQGKPDSPTALKRKVAIARFTNETKYGQSFFIDKNNDRIGKQAVDMLSAKLVASEKFILLERADLEKIQKELSLGDASTLKNMADYLIVGSITGFGRRDQSRVGVFSRVKKQTAFAKVSIRLIDVYTGQIIYSEEGEGEAYSEAGTVVGIGAKAGYDSILNDKALDAAITNLSSNIIENLMDKPWRAYILGYDKGYYIVSGGTSQNIRVGNEFNVFLEGKKIKNPQTNMYITLPGEKVGVLKVKQCVGDSVQNEVSLCTLVDGNLHTYTASNRFSNLYIQEK